MSHSKMEPPSSHPHFCLRWNNHRNNLLSSFNEIFQTGAYADVSFQVEGESNFVVLKCHRMVLAASSTYFERFFSHSQDQNPVIIVPGVREIEMKAILEYIYQGEVSVTEETMMDILKVARLLQIKGLMEYEKGQGRNLSVSPPPAISSTERSISFGTDGIHNEYRSPPHSTSALSLYSHPRALANHPAQHIPPVWNSLSSLSLAAHSVLNSPMAPRTPLFPQIYETDDNDIRKQINTLMLSRDTPILRTVLGQGHADSSQGIPQYHGDAHDVYRSSSNGSAHDMNEVCRNSLDLSHTRHSNGHNPYSFDMKVEDVESAAVKGNALCRPRNKNCKEWKRYKQYTKEHMDKAITAVKRGETALKASKAFGIPSRTLYDKVKKMGITTPRNGRRIRTTSSGAHFPSGIGGNRNGDIYRGILDHDNDNDYNNGMMEGSACLLDLACGRGRHQSDDQEASLDDSTKSMSPDDIQRQEIENDNDEHAQDLSINRRNVIVTPNDEKGDASKT